MLKDCLWQVFFFFLGVTYIYKMPSELKTNTLDCNHIGALMDYVAPVIGDDQAAVEELWI